MYGECVTRKEAEKMMKTAIEDYLSISQLQDILEVIFDDDTYMVIEDGDIPEEEEDA